MAKRIGLYLFATDLRLHDQPALSQANEHVEELLCLYQAPLVWEVSSKRMVAQLGPSRQAFLDQCVMNLEQQLQTLGQHLWLTTAPLEDTLYHLVSTLGITDIFYSAQAGFYENQCRQRLRDRLPNSLFHRHDSHTLFAESDLPFSLSNLPAGFNGMRRKLEKIAFTPAISALDSLPALPEAIANKAHHLGLQTVADAHLTRPQSHMGPQDHHFIGGEHAGLKHLTDYFNSGAASRYKHTRNALDGWRHSCKFSPWLATGSLSVRQVATALKQYEALHGVNESSHWIFVELLWREYFQWYAKRHREQLFQLGGPHQKAASHSTNPASFQQWVEGQTAFPLVNACMLELKLTGFLSNRGRQIVASCLVNELDHDWREGAAYFEKMLIDYDVATNWGNWSYIAGAGPTTVNKRHFNLIKQAQQFDPKRQYTDYWLAQRPTT